MRIVRLLFSAFAIAIGNVSVFAAGVNLTGTISASDGEPAKGARVFIYTAQPKDGPGILCPSCYPDCKKRATADAEGKFLIENLDPELVFRVLVVGKDHQPKFIKDVDPERNNDLNIFLQPTFGDGGEGNPKSRLHGKILDTGGKPIEGAVVTTRGVTRGEGTRFGGNHDIDPLAVSDEQGSFEIRGDSDFDAAGVDVEANGFAKRVFPTLATGGKVHELRLNEGATVRGRVLKEGKPLAWMDVGISGAERRSEVYVGNQTVATDNEGKFAFVNVPAETQFQFYGIMKSLLKHGALRTRGVHTGAPGSTVDLGDLELEPSFTVAGKVVLADGESAPENTRVYLGREDAWDSWQKTIDEEGKFEFHGIPADETLTLSTRLSGYRLTTKNAGLDPYNPYHLVGRIVTNKTDLVLELEPGRNHDRLDGDYQTARQQILRGAEAGPRVGDIKISGTVTDENGKPLPNFTVTEGRAHEFQPGSINWFTTRKTEHTNGTFTTYFSKLAKAPAVLIEAEGYKPHSSGTIDASETNLVIALKKGSGIEGVIMKPDGSAADGVTIYLTDMQNGVYAQGPPLELRENMQRGIKKTESDEQGRFKFPAQIDAFSVIVVDDTGFADVRVEQLEQTKEIRLQPWAQVKGWLQIGSKPGTNETVRLSLAYIPGEHHPRSFSALGLYLTEKTDENGNYDFDRVPPVAVQIYHEPKVRESRTGTIAVSQDTRLVLEPGKTHEINLGGKGRPVTGKMVVEDYEGEISWRADVHSLELIVPQPEGFPDHAKIFALTERKCQKPRPRKSNRPSEEKCRNFRKNTP